MKLIAINVDGTPVISIEELPELAWDVIKSTAEMCRSVGYQPPWVGYLAVDGGKCVGTCAFKTAPMDGRVEIAYFTFPGYEGRGVATRMTESLIGIAQQVAPNIRICAQTLPESNSSTRVLEKVGFEKIAEVEHPEDGIVWEWELKKTTQSYTIAISGGR